MAVTLNSDMKIYDRTMQTAYLERIQEVNNVFNQNSNGAITLSSEVIEGDFDKAAFYTTSTDVVSRNVNANGDQTPAKLGSNEMIGVKCPWKMPVIDSTEESFKRRGVSPEQHFEVVGQRMADSLIKYQCQAALKSLNGAITGNAGMKATSSLGTNGKKVLTAALRKYGDRFERVALWVMNSADYFDLVDQAITDKIFNEADVVIYGGMPGTMGRPVLVSDTATAGVVYGLVNGAVQIVESQAPGILNERVGLKENITLRSQAEGTFNTELMGYSFTGSANPDLTALNAYSNWTQYATSDKATAGVQLTITT